jgi:ATP-binding cassette subfamily B (MDR/TAP) protein 1
MASSTAGSRDEDIQHVEVGFMEKPSGDRASFRALFAFTTKRQYLLLFPATVIATISGALRPVLAIFLGYIFDELISYGAGSSDESRMIHNVSKWCTVLAGVGAATLLANGAFFALWLLFGEAQARTVRRQAFSSLLKKDMSWYDMKTEGIGSYLIRFQT